MRDIAVKHLGVSIAVVAFLADLPASRAGAQEGMPGACQTCKGERKAPCEFCEGKGRRLLPERLRHRDAYDACAWCAAKGEDACVKCGGRGTVVPLQEALRCPKCAGRGRVACLVCDGYGKTHKAAQSMPNDCLACDRKRLYRCGLCDGDGFVERVLPRGRESDERRLRAIERKLEELESARTAIVEVLGMDELETTLLRGARAHPALRGEASAYRVQFRDAASVRKSEEWGDLRTGEGHERRCYVVTREAALRLLDDEASLLRVEREAVEKALRPESPQSKPPGGG